MISEHEIQLRMVELFEDHASLDEFEDWLVAESWNIHKGGDEMVQRLVGAIELRLSEFSSGHLNESDLLKELELLMPRNPGISVIRVGPVSNIMSGSGTWLETPLTPLRVIERADIEFAEESA